MYRHVLQSVVCLVLLWQGSVTAGSEAFIVTERFAPEIAPASASSLAFVVTDRDSPLPIAGVAEPGSANTPRPVVWFYSAKWCVPCQVARQELERAHLPFELRVVDVTQGGQPDYVDGIPYFEWKSPRGRWFAKWTNAADLIKRWELTR